MPKQDINLRLAAALASPEPGVNPPSRSKASSFSAQVADLAVGETAPRLQAIDNELTLTDVQADLAATRERLRNSVASAVKQAKTRTGGGYSVEVCDLHTPGGKWFIVALVTRAE